jgi:hypothetical protein
MRGRDEKCLSLKNCSQKTGKEVAGVDVCKDVD